MKTELGLALAALGALGCAEIAGLDDLEPLPASDAKARSVLFDFETGDLSGWPTFSDPASTLTLELVESPAAGTRAMKMSYVLAAGGYAGAEHVFEPGGQWIAYSGLGAKAFANATGHPLRFEIYDSDQERFERVIAADWSGFRDLVLPFSSFVKSTFQPPYALENGTLDLDAVSGLAISPSFEPATSGSVVIDEIALLP